MNILAVETSSPVLSVALQRRDGMTKEIIFETGLHHVEKLMLFVRELLSELQIKKEKIDLIVCGVGPGSFTGLRVGLSAVKGLALGLGKKIVAVSSLDLIAEGAGLSEEKLAVVLDARRERLYTALYQFKAGTPRKILKDSLLSLDQLIKLVDSNTVFTGSALVTYGDQIEKKLGRDVRWLDEKFWHPKASSIFSLLKHNQAAVKTIPLRQLKPMYLRLSEAEEKRKTIKRQTHARAAC